VGLLRCCVPGRGGTPSWASGASSSRSSRRFRADDPRFASAVHAAGPRVRYKRRGTEAALGFLIGVGLLLAGVVINVILIAVAGFVVMLACSMWAVTSSRRMTGTTGRVPAKDRRSGKKRRAAKARRSGKQAGSGLMGRRLEER
jgi:predicted lipid-binding transport protein (Tim44 family)